MPETNHFRLLDHIGVTADEQPEPLVEERVTRDRPIMVDDGKGGQIPTTTSETVSIQPAASIGAADLVQARIIPGTRIVESRDPIIDAALRGFGKYEQIDSPIKKDIDAAVKETRDSVERAKGFDDLGFERSEQRAEEAAARAAESSNESKGE